MTKEELIIYAIRTSEAIKEEKKQELIDYVSNLQQENQELKEENKQLKDNWNKLKETRIKILEAEIEQLYEFIAKIQHLGEIEQQRLVNLESKDEE